MSNWAIAFTLMKTSTMLRVILVEPAWLALSGRTDRPYSTRHFTGTDAEAVHMQECALPLALATAWKMVRHAVLQSAHRQVAVSARHQYAYVISDTTNQ